MLKFKRIVLLLTSILALWLSFSAWSIYSFAAVTDNRPADAIVVLGAAAWGVRPSPVFRERINHAIDLYHNGYAPLIIFTGGKLEGDLYTESEVARQYAIDRGVAAQDILVETVSTSTAENLHYAGQIAADHNLATLIIVSDPLHMKRAMLIAQDLGLDAYSSPTPTSRYRTLGPQTEFLMRETYFYQKYRLYRLLFPIQQ